MESSLTNWDRDSRIEDVRDIRKCLEDQISLMKQVNEDIDSLNFVLHDLNLATKKLSDGLIPVLGSDSITLSESSALVESICGRLLLAHKDIVGSYERLTELKRLLLSHDNQIITGDAEILRKATLVFVDKFDRIKKTEHLHRSASNFLRALTPYVEQEFLEKLKETLPKDS